MYGYGNYDYGLGNYSYGTNMISRMESSMLAVTIISALIALVLAIYFLSRGRYEASRLRPGLHGLFRFVNFDMYVFSTVQKFLYLFITIFVIIASFVVMFQDGGFTAGLVMLITGPIVVRLVYELLYIIFAIRDHLASINRTLLDIKQGGVGSENAPTRTSAYADTTRPVNPAPRPAPRPASRFCPNCGKEVKNGAPFCTNCGNKM